VKVNPRFTSQTCAECNYVDAGNRVRQEEFRCLACGHCAHADNNAARNILRAGRACRLRPALVEVRHYPRVSMNKSNILVTGRQRHRPRMCESTRERWMDRRGRESSRHVGRILAGPGDDVDSDDSVESAFDHVSANTGN